MKIDEQTIYSIVDKAKKYDELTFLNKTKLLQCDFCGKSQNEVKKLIASSDGVYICNECVELCMEIIEEECGVE